MAQRQSQSRDQSQEQVQGRRQRKARLHRVMIQGGLDDLDLQDASLFTPGLIGDSDCPDPDDCVDSDLMLEEEGGSAGDDADAVVDAGPDEDELPDDDEGTLGMSFSDIASGSSRVVLMRLRRTHTGAEAVPCMETRSAKTREALVELQGFIDSVFAQKPESVSKEDWEWLLRPDTFDRNTSEETARTLLLLTRIGIAVSQHFAVRDAYSTTVKNHDARRLRSKFAALPCGTPFNLGLLIRDGRRRGRRGGSASNSELLGLCKVPDGLMLPCLRLILEEERKLGKAKSDHELTGVFGQRLEALGIAISEIDESDVGHLRTRLQHGGVVFPNKRERQRWYSDP